MKTAENDGRAYLFMAADFDQLTPRHFLPDLEEALSVEMTGFASALSSYVNRVYEMETVSGDRVIVKFYRPGRWSEDAILDEHDFLWDCDAEDIPVAAPYELSHGSTLGFSQGIPFAVFPKLHGRQAEFEGLESFRRAGILLGHIHACGARRRAEYRMEMTPESFAFRAMERLFESGAVSVNQEEALKCVCEDLLALAGKVFEEGFDFLRIHGDFHRGNILLNTQNELSVMDFDDMVNGPAVQDFWLLLPGYADECAGELEALLEGYEMFRSFDRREIRLIEPLRAMRMMHFLSWCAVQKEDRRFREWNPDWGTEGFWRKEVQSLSAQLARMKKVLRF